MKSYWQQTDGANRSTHMPLFLHRKSEGTIVHSVQQKDLKQQKEAHSPKPILPLEILQLDGPQDEVAHSGKGKSKLKSDVTSIRRLAGV